MQNRWKSVPLITALAAQILSMLVLIGVIDVSQSETINGLIVALCQVLTAFGIINNPTDPAHL